MITTYCFLLLYINLFDHSATDGPPGCTWFSYFYLSIAKMASLHTEPLNVGLNSRSGMVGLKVDPVKSLADSTKLPSQMSYHFILLPRTCESVLFCIPSSALDTINFIQYFPIVWGTWTISLLFLFAFLLRISVVSLHK